MSASLSPWIVARDGDALLGFLAEVFGARETGRVPTPEGRIGHAEAELPGGGTVVVIDAHEGWAATPAYLRLQVAELDATVARAVAAGGVVVTARTSMPFGEDVARVTDPWGNLWWLHERVAEVELSDLIGLMGQEETLRTMAAFEASLDAEMRRRAASGHSLDSSA